MDNTQTPKQAFQRNRSFWLDHKISGIYGNLKQTRLQLDRLQVLTDEEKTLLDDIQEKFNHLLENKSKNYYKKKQEIFKDE